MKMLKLTKYKSDEIDKRILNVLRLNHNQYKKIRKQDDDMDWVNIAVPTRLTFDTAKTSILVERLIPKEKEVGNFNYQHILY
jgi:hypothetical protein